MARLLPGKVWPPVAQGRGKPCSWIGRLLPGLLDTPFPKARSLQANTGLSKCVVTSFVILREIQGHKIWLEPTLSQPIEMFCCNQDRGYDS